jgi:uncharacterized RDD family membrane protein YckC
MSMQGNPASPALAQCSVTGKMVPEDELVTIQGHRVCAEGKAILLERLKSGEALPGESEKPTVLRRFGCIFLDGLIIGVPLAIINAVIARGGASPATLGLISLVGNTVNVIYFGQLHGSRGQSVGKMAGKLKVVNNLDGSPITLQTAYVRALAYVGPSYLSGLALVLGNGALIGVASIAVGAYGIINVLMALFDKNRQRALHDRIAGTRVIDIQ